MDKETRNLLFMGVLGFGAAYGLYRLLVHFKEEFKKGTDENIAKPIADAINRLRLPPPSKLLAAIQFSNGFILDVNKVTGGIYSVGDKSKFKWQGNEYTLGPRNDAGYYTAR